MKNNPLWHSIVEHISLATGTTLNFVKTEALSGGDINRVYHLHCQQRGYFVKLNRADLLPMFTTELLALNELAQTHTLRIPHAITTGIAADKAFLVLEYVPLTRLTASSQQQLGTQLAQLHRQQQPYFGWHEDNYIGSNPQNNNRHHDWVSFWQQHRLGAQLNLAAENGYQGKLQTLGEKLLPRVGHFFSSYQPQPSLLHGDVWAGNAAQESTGQAIIYDPASYYRCYRRGVKNCAAHLPRSISIPGCD